MFNPNFVHDILISGYTEKNFDNTLSFHPMMNRIYVCVQENIIQISYDTITDDDIKISYTENIECWFDLEDDDIFSTSTLLPYLAQPASGHITSNMELTSLCRLEDDVLVILSTGEFSYKINFSKSFNGLIFKTCLCKNDEG